MLSWGMKKALMIVACSLVLAPVSTALANSGDDQYCDPFSGCGTPTKHPKPPKSSKQPKNAKHTRVASGYSGSDSSPLISPVKPADNLASIENKLQIASLLTTKSTRSQVEQERLADARNVLRAAGLDSLNSFYS